MKHNDEVQNRENEVSFRDVGRLVRIVVVLIVLAATVLVALDNRDDVRLGYVFGDADAPVWVAMVGAGLAGLLIGLVARRRRSGT